MHRFTAVLCAALVAWAGCTQGPNPQPDPSGTHATPSSVPSARLTQTAPQPGIVGDARRAELGKTAPDFTLTDLDGKLVRLSDARGKIVVLEWFNPECPFVNLAHTKGSLNGLAQKHAQKGVVWLAINSGAPGKQGYGVDANRAGKARFGLSHPILLDETGEVGKAYGAKRTPHMFVIDAKGTLVYAGAIDNSPDGEQESPKGGSLINYVDACLDDLTARGPVRYPMTEAYGCGVKYAGG